LQNNLFYFPFMTGPS